MKYPIQVLPGKNRINYNHIIYMCVFLACLVPRYIATFKIRIGINVSLYSIIVIIFWLFGKKKLTYRKTIESSFFLIWITFIMLSVWRADNIGSWAYYLLWALTALLFQQLLITYHNEDTCEYVIKALTDALFIHLLIGLYEITTHQYLFLTGNISRSRR